MTMPKITPVKVPAMPKPAGLSKPSMPSINRAPEIAGQNRPRSVFRPIKLENPPHWSGR